MNPIYNVAALSDSNHSPLESLEINSPCQPREPKIDVKQPRIPAPIETASSTRAFFF